MTKVLGTVREPLGRRVIRTISHCIYQRCGMRFSYGFFLIPLPEWVHHVSVIKTVAARKLFLFPTWTSCDCKDCQRGILGLITEGCRASVLWRFPSCGVAG